MLLPGPDRAALQKPLQTVRHRFAEVRMFFRRQRRDEPMPCEGAAQRPRAVRDLDDRCELIGSPEGFEVRVAEPDDLGSPRLEAEPPGGGTESHGQGVERVRNDGVAPVEYEVVAVPYEDLAVVEIVVLDRLRDPFRGEPVDERPHLRQSLAQLLVLRRRQALGFVDHEPLAVFEQALDASGKSGEALVPYP